MKDHKRVLYFHIDAIDAVEVVLPQDKLSHVLITRRGGEPIIVTERQTADLGGACDTLNAWRAARNDDAAPLGA